MSDTDTRRLRVLVRVKTSPVTVAIEFIDEDLAKLYFRSIRGSTLKKPRLENPSTVTMELSSLAVDIEMSRSLGAFVVHFNNDDSAKRYMDDICRPIRSQAQQVYIKEYWSGAKFEQLKGALEQKSRGKMVGEALKDANAGQAAYPDRAGTPPGESIPSSKSKWDF